MNLLIRPLFVGPEGCIITTSRTSLYYMYKVLQLTNNQTLPLVFLSFRLLWFQWVLFQLKLFMFFLCWIILQCSYVPVNTSVRFNVAVRSTKTGTMNQTNPSRSMLSSGYKIK